MLLPALCPHNRPRGKLLSFSPFVDNTGRKNNGRAEGEHLDSGIKIFNINIILATIS